MSEITQATMQSEMILDFDSLQYTLSHTHTHTRKMPAKNTIGYIALFSISQIINIHTIYPNPRHYQISLKTANRK